MEIMNYNQMLENANAVKVLVNTTIECSKDYTDIQSNDILDKIAAYIAETINDVLHDTICDDILFCSHADCGGLRFGNYIGKSNNTPKHAKAQFFFSYRGTHLRLLLSPIGYWWEDKFVTDNGLKKLIKDWPVMKQQMNHAIVCGIKAYNDNLSHKLTKQLELHEVIKNFKV